MNYKMCIFRGGGIIHRGERMKKTYVYLSAKSAFPNLDSLQRISVLKVLSNGFPADLGILGF